MYLITSLKSKIHRARVTDTNVDYEGSCAIDRSLLDFAGIRVYEQIHIYNITNGERFTTYAIEAERGSRTVSIFGAGAHKVSRGDHIIICAYGAMDTVEASLDRSAPRIVYLDENNYVTSMK